jgi:hypothetical protein
VGVGEAMTAACQRVLAFQIVAVKALANQVYLLSMNKKKNSLLYYFIFFYSHGAMVELSLFLIWE